MTSIQRYPVHFVGAGPGDIGLITVKGRRLLDDADIIVYAGSLVNPKLLDGCRAAVHDSSGLDLGEILELMVKGWQQGLKVVRLHTGDPSIYGAIHEQMVLLDEKSIPYEVIPGVSSAFAAAASLKAELTLPELAQTVIITRMEGRTPVPEREKLSLLASHQATMLIFLSASLLTEVVAELAAGGYPEETPVVIVERASWENERIIRGTLASICSLADEHQVRKTAMICVGRVFARQLPITLSKLYDRHFSHGTREARDD